MSHQDDQELAKNFAEQAKQMRTQAENRAENLMARARELEAEAHELRQTASQLRAAMLPEQPKPHLSSPSQGTYKREDSMDPDFW